MRNKIILLFLFFFLTSYSQNDSRTKILERKLYYVFDIIQKDSIQKSLTILNEVLIQAQKDKDDFICAMDNNVFGLLFTQIENYDTSLIYYGKALKLYKKIKRPDKEAAVLSNMAQSYLYKKDYNGLDSILKVAKEYDNKTFIVYKFHNYEYQIIKLFEQQKYNELNDLCIKANEELAKIPLNIEKKNKLYIESLIRKRLQMLYNLYDSFALINLKNYDIGYKKILVVEKENPLKIFWNKSQLYELKEHLHYYKFLYFKDFIKNKDSAIANLLLTNKYHKIAISKVREKAGINGKFIYSAITNEAKLKQQQEIHKKEKEKNKYLSMLIFLLILFSILLLIFLIVLKTKNIKIKKINHSLKEASSELNKRNKILTFNEKNRTRFFSIVSHEFRTPLYGIKGILGLIRNEGFDDGKLKNLFTIGNNAVLAIDNALIFSKINFDKKEDVVLENIRFNDLINSILISQKDFAFQKNIDIDIKCDFYFRDIEIVSNREILANSLLNMLNNAIKFSDENEKVELEINILNESGDTVKLLYKVSNKGIIQADKLPFIFKAYKYQEKFNDSMSGVGIGLFVTNYLLKKINSECKLNYTNGNIKFYFETDLKYIEKGTNEFNKKNDFISILVVDDNKLNLMITKKNIEKIFNNVKVETVLSGNEAINKIEDNYDLIFMDINMPEMDGYQTSKIIKEVNNHIPIIALTALGKEEIDFEKLKKCMDGFITKPYHDDDLKSVIEKYCTN